MNRVVLIGRITKDPEIRRIPTTNNAVVSFTIAVDNFGKDQNGERRQATFVPCTIWGKQAENMARFTRKGSNIGIEGRIVQRSFTRKDGTPATVLEVVCDNIQFLDSKGAGEGQDVPTPVSLEEANESSTQGFSIDDEDLPF